MSDRDEVVDRAEVAESRNQEIWRRWCQGERQQDIAESVGISRSRVAQVIQQERGKIPRRTREEYRRDMAAQLDDLRELCADIAASKPAPAYRGSEPIRDPETDEPVWDHAGRLAAVDRIVKIDERLSKLLGLDDPEKVSTDATVRYIVEGVNTEHLS